MKKQSEARKVGFLTPKKGKTFKQAKLAVSGRKFKINEALEDSYELSIKTAATQSKRGRPKKTVPNKKAFPRTNKRKAKINASSVIKQMYSVSKKQKTLRSLKKGEQGDFLFYF